MISSASGPALLPTRRRWRWDRELRRWTRGQLMHSLGGCYTSAWSGATWESWRSRIFEQLLRFRRRTRQRGHRGRSRGRLYGIGRGIGEGLGCGGQGRRK
jgi:hypothetical protein